MLQARGSYVPPHERNTTRSGRNFEALTQDTPRRDGSSIYGNRRQRFGNWGDSKKNPNEFRNDPNRRDLNYRRVSKSELKLKENQRLEEEMLRTKMTKVVPKSSDFPTLGKKKNVQTESQASSVWQESSKLIRKPVEEVVEITAISKKEKDREEKLRREEIERMIVPIELGPMRNHWLYKSSSRRLSEEGEELINSDDERYARFLEKHGEFEQDLDVEFDEDGNIVDEYEDAEDEEDFYY